MNENDEIAKLVYIIQKQDILLKEKSKENEIKDKLLYSLSQENNKKEAWIRELSLEDKKKEGVLQVLHQENSYYKSCYPIKVIEWIKRVFR